MLNALSLVFAAVAAVAALITVSQAREAHRESEADRRQVRLDRERDLQATERDRHRRLLEEIGQIVEQVAAASSSLAPPRTQDRVPLDLESPLLRLRLSVIGHRAELPRCCMMAYDVKDGVYHGSAATGARDEIEQALHCLAEGS